MRTRNRNQRSHRRVGTVTAAIAIFLLAACSAKTAGPMPAAGAASEPPAPAAHGAHAEHHAGPAPATANPADARFMSMMIGHHAQAIVMARMATTHGASPSIETLSGRIINAQQDEITLIQRWLSDHGEPVPEQTAAMKHAMGGEHGMMMPGMLTEAQLKELDAARGEEFDRLFLRYMIEHHKGATTMVKELFSSYGATQDHTVFKLASDINAEQTTEIARMQRMLFDLIVGKDPQ